MRTALITATTKTAHQKITCFHIVAMLSKNVLSDAALVVAGQVPSTSKRHAHLRRVKPVGAIQYAKKPYGLRLLDGSDMTHE